MIAIWAWFQTSIILEKAIGIPVLPGGLLTAPIIFILGIALGVTLFQMRPRARITAIVVFVVTSISMIQGLVRNWFGLVEYPLLIRAQVLFFVMIAINVLSVVYLKRSEFKTLCFAYRKSMAEYKMVRRDVKLPKP